MYDTHGTRCAVWCKRSTVRTRTGSPIDNLALLCSHLPLSTLWSSSGRELGSSGPGQVQERALLHVSRTVVSSFSRTSDGGGDRVGLEAGRVGRRVGFDSMFRKVRRSAGAGVEFEKYEDLSELVLQYTLLARR